MTPRVIVVSGADAQFWPLLSGMLNSIDARRRSANMSVGIFDLGLEPGQVARLKAYGATVVVPQWDYDISTFTREPPPYFRAMTARPNLPAHFPGHDIYLWLDADCWVQDWRAVDMLCLAAKDWGFSCVPELDRAYQGYAEEGPFVALYTGWLVRCFGEEIAAKYAYEPMLNCGVFAASAASPLWAAWRNSLGRAFERLREPFFFAEQTALNVCVRENQIPAAYLPARCNWMCNRALPRLSFDGNVLIEPQPPFEPLGILHLAAESKKGTKPLVDLNGKRHERPLTFPPLP